jgi:hypothetical protein
LSFTFKKSIEEIASQFSILGEIVLCEKHGNGNVNDTYLIHCKDDEGLNRYTLQLINHQVFHDPESLMRNFERVTSHLLKKSIEKNHGMEVLTLVPTFTGKSFTRDDEGRYWRMTKFIAGGRSFEIPEHNHHAFEAAKAFGKFQADLNDMEGPNLVETIPDFHNTRKRFDRFEEVCKHDAFDRVKEVHDLVNFIRGNEALSDVIIAEEFPVRVVHNDTKLNNVLLHKSTGQGMCVVDLDTVMPGCVLHDFGDLVRTAASSAREDEPDLKKIRFLMNRFESILEGYLEGTGGMLEKKELDGLAIAPLVITFELGIRFLTDYLEGDSYFKISFPDHNLVRARAQIALLSSMQKVFQEMKDLVNKGI